MHLVFHYDGRHDPVVVGKQTVTAETLDQAAWKVATARNVTWVHVRTVDGVTVGKRFEFLPPPY
jgi:hypothetical protein